MFFTFLFLFLCDTITRAVIPILTVMTFSFCLPGPIFHVLCVVWEGIIDLPHFRELLDLSTTLEPCNVDWNNASQPQVELCLIQNCCGKMSDDRSADANGSIESKYIINGLLKLFVSSPVSTAESIFNKPFGCTWNWMIARDAVLR